MSVRCVDGANRTELAHRLAWAIAVGPIPPGLFVLHTCDNPPCVRREHLFTGTSAENTADKMAKGRHRVLAGEEHGMAKLTDAQVVEVRAEWARFKADLATRYGISEGYVRAILAGRKR